jgi:hypothetical protein
MGIRSIVVTFLSFPPPSSKMSAKSYPGFQSRVSSRFSSLKKRASSIFSLPPPASSSRLDPRLPGDNSGGLVVPGHHADTHLSLETTSHCPSVSSVSEQSTVNPVSVYPLPSPQHFTHHSEDLAHQNYPSTHLAPSSLFHLPPGQASTFQGSSVSAMLNLKHSLTFMPALVQWSSQFCDE